MKLFIGGKRHCCIQIISAVTESIIDRPALKCNLLAPDNKLQDLQTNIVHILGIMLHHPVKEEIHLLKHAFLISLLQETIHPLLIVAGKCFIIHTILGKILNMYHTAEAAIQRTKSLAVRTLHLRHLPDSSDSYTEFSIQTVLQPCHQLPGFFHQINTVLIRILGNLAGNYHRDTIRHNISYHTGKRGFHHIPKFRVKALRLHIHPNRAHQPAVLIALPKLHHHNKPLCICNIQKLLVIICCLHLLLEKQSTYIA